MREKERISDIMLGKSSTLRKGVFFAIFMVSLIAVFTLCCMEVSGKTLYVDDDGTSEYTRIQYAVENATDGDTIMVFEGTYNEKLFIGKSVTLIGNGSANTTINAGENGSVVRIMADYVNMSGFRVTGSEQGFAGLMIIIVVVIAFLVGTKPSAGKPEVKKEETEKKTEVKEETKSEDKREVEKELKETEEKEGKKEIKKA